MDVLTAKPQACLLCGQECQVILRGLFDDRFGVPGCYDIVRCFHCGLERTIPTPSETELKELYERFYNWGGERETRYTRIRQQFFNSALYRLWLQWDGDISFHLRSGSGRLLDIGCNEGRGLSFYARNGFQVEGLEVNELAAARARDQGFTVYTEPLDQISPEKPYDTIVLSNVIEHAVDPIAMLTQVRRLLLPEGQVWISCPNAASRWRRVFARHWINWHVPFHICHFSSSSLQEVLARAHFSILELKTCTPALWLALSLCTLLASRTGRANRLMRSAPVIAGLMLAVRGILCVTGQNNATMSGDCLIAIASKEP